MRVAELLRSILPGDEITTNLGRTFVVDTVHDDGWIEPRGADDYTWFIPIQNVVKINGKAVEPIKANNSSNSQS